MSLIYIVDTKSVLNYLRQEGKNKKFDKEQKSIELLKKIIMSVNSLLQNHKELTESYVLLFDGVQNQLFFTFSEYQALEKQLNNLGIEINQILDIQFSGSIFSSTDVCKRYLREKVSGTKKYLVSSDYTLSTFAIENGHEFVKPEEFILKLDFMLDNKFEINTEIVSFNDNIKKSKSIVEKDTFNLLDFFTENKLQTEVIDNVKNRDLRRIPKYEDVKKTKQSEELVKSKNKNLDTKLSDKQNKQNKQNKSLVEEKEVSSKIKLNKQFDNLQDLAELLKSQKER